MVLITGTFERTRVPMACSRLFVRVVQHELPVGQGERVCDTEENSVH
jgi:hypothetical protein